MQTPSIIEMLKAGVHFGHQTGKRHPKMIPYIFTVRSGVHIINLEETARLLQEAANFARDMAKKKGTLLFVGTKKQTQEKVANFAKSCGMPYITERWIGGLLTNFSVVKQRIKQYRVWKEQRELGSWDKYTKKEQLILTKKFERLEKLFSGVANLDTAPDAVILVDLKREKTALREARKQHIPLISLCDTNTNPSLIDHPIPANDDAIKSVELILQTLTDAINEGRKLQEQSVAANPVARESKSAQKAVFPKEITEA